MGTHPIFESDFDCLTEKNGAWTKEEHWILGEGARAPQKLLSEHIKQRNGCILDSRALRRPRPDLDPGANPSISCWRANDLPRFGNASASFCSSVCIQKCQERPKGENRPATNRSCLRRSYRPGRHQGRPTRTRRQNSLAKG